MSTQVAVYLQDAHAVREGMEIAQYAEAKGFHAIWQAESRLVREATVPMAAFLAVTERIKVGSGVVNNWTRNPALLASTFSTLDDLAPGRVILGIGAWWEPFASKVGVKRVKPLVAMRETIEAVRASARRSDTSPTKASSSISTVSSSTTSIRSAGRRTCPSTSGRPACR